MPTLCVTTHPVVHNNTSLVHANTSVVHADTSVVHNNTSLVHANTSVVHADIPCDSSWHPLRCVTASPAVCHYIPRGA